MARSTKTTEKTALYSVHPGVTMIQNWIASLPEKTGRSLDEWLRFVKKEGPPAEKDRRVWLKEKHGMGTNAAWWIAERAEGKGIEDGDPKTYLKAAAKYVEDMFAGSKSGLRPIYVRLLKMGLGLGKDVMACPCQTIVPLYRNHVFAQLKPSTQTRLDLGLALKDAPARGRLIDTGGFAKKDRITHRIPISSLEEIDEEVKKWMRKAYELDA